jgi:hypothetical protein
MQRFTRLIIAVALAACGPSFHALASAPSGASASSAPEARDIEARLKALEEQIQALKAQIEALRKTSPTPDAASIERLEKQIDALSREIESLKMGEAAAAPVAGSSVHGFGPAASKVYQLREGVSLGGYGEMVYRDFAGKDDSGGASGEPDRLDLLRAVFYFGYKWNDRILFNSEIEFEHATTGEGDEEKGEVSVEFAYLDFLSKKGFNARAGLVLLPLGIINEMHEPTTFPGVLRPRVETAIIPTTWREAGAGVFGETKWIAYRAYLVAGLDALGFTAEEGLREGRQGGSNSLAEDFALTGRLDMIGVPGLVAGVGAFSGNSGQGQIPAGARVDLIDIHAQFQWRGLEARGLWTQASLEDVAVINQALGIAAGSDESVGEHLKGWYLQAAFDLLSLGAGSSQMLAPFVRYEALDTQDGVPDSFVQNPAFQQRVRSIGLTWKPIPQVALKADYQDVDNGAGTGVDEYHLGLGWIF